MSGSAHSTATAEHPSETTGQRTALATVCISGTLEDKLDAAAGAGFDGVEIFEPDLVASALSPAEIRGRCADLGLSIDLYQPFRDLDSTDPERFAHNLRRAERKFELMAELGTELILVCSAVAPDAVADLDLAGRPAACASPNEPRRTACGSPTRRSPGARVSTYEQSWGPCERADHPALGLCLDSFHILSRGSDPAGIEAIPAEKLFFLQLADAPHMNMDVLQWSRHYRLFPGQGAFDLPAFLGHVLTAGYTGPLSLEVFNDVFRQSDPRRAAVDARRSLLALREAAAPDARHRRREPAAHPGAARVRVHRVTVDAPSGTAVAALLAALGFVHTGQHRSKPVQLWEQGERGCCSTSPAAPTGRRRRRARHRDRRPRRCGGPGRRAARPAAAAAPRPGEADLLGVTAPDGTAMFFCHTADRRRELARRLHADR